MDIPTGFHLCDGGAETVDLRNQFIVGAGDSYAQHDTGGAASHDHDFTSGVHNHVMGAGTDINAGTDFENITTDVAVVGTTDVDNHLPPYYALAYIQKI